MDQDNVQDTLNQDSIIMFIIRTQEIVLDRGCSGRPEFQSSDILYTYIPEECGWS